MAFKADHEYLAVARAKSGNEKIGDVAVTYAAQPSCPTDCPFIDGGGCYAETGRVGMFLTRPLNDAAERLHASAVDVAQAEADAIDGLDVGDRRPLRLHSVGDCASDETARIVSAAAARYMERGGGPVFTYTHAWRAVDRDSWGRVSVLASCETPADAALARARGYAPSIVVEEFESRRLYHPTDVSCRTAREIGASPSGTSGRLTGQRPGSGDAPVISVPILPCPAQTRPGVTCASCRLCMSDGGLLERGYAIGFELHGIPMTVRRARLALRRPDDPERREPVETLLRGLLADRPGLKASEAAAELVMSEGYAGQLLNWMRGLAEHPSALRQQRHRNRPRVPAKAGRVEGALRRLLAAVDERALTDPVVRAAVADQLEETVRRLRTGEAIAA